MFPFLFLMPKRHSPGFNERQHYYKARFQRVHTRWTNTFVIIDIHLVTIYFLFPRSKASLVLIHSTKYSVILPSSVFSYPFLFTLFLKIWLNRDFEMLYRFPCRTSFFQTFSQRTFRSFLFKCLFFFLCYVLLFYRGLCVKGTSFQIHVHDLIYNIIKLIFKLL